MSTTTEIDLHKFCDRTRVGYTSIGEPWVVDGWMVATDARVMIFVPCGEPNTVPPQPPMRFPDVSHFIRSRDTTSPLVEWPEVNYVSAMRQCVSCEGTGYADTPDCDECNGSGEVTCHCCGNTDDCDECGGEGWIGQGVCDECNGTKKSMQKCHQLICNRRILYTHDALIRSLPGVRYRNDGKTSIHDPLHFDFDGGWGIVMSQPEDQ